MVVEAEQEFELRPFGPRVCALCSELDYEPSESEVLSHSVGSNSFATPSL